MPILPPAEEVETIAVLIPTSSPLRFTRAPPELPWLMSRIRLDHMPGSLALDRDGTSSLRADHAYSDGALKPERVANGNDPLAFP